MISPTAPSLISPTTSPPAHSSPAIFIFSEFQESTQQVPTSGPLDLLLPVPRTYSSQPATSLTLPLLRCPLPRESCPDHFFKKSPIISYFSW